MYIDDYDVMDTIMDLFVQDYGPATRDMHMSCLCLLTEFAGLTLHMSDRLFSRIEQFVYARAQCDSPGGVLLHESCMLLLLKAMHSHSRALCGAVIARAVSSIVSPAQHIHKKHTSFNGVKCLKYIVETQKSRIFCKDFRSMCMFLSNLYAHIAHMSASTTTDLLYVLTVATRMLDKDTWYATSGVCILISSLLPMASVSDIDVKNVIQIIGNYAHRNIILRESAALFLDYSCIAHFVDNIRHSRIKYSTTLLYNMLTLMQVILMNKIDNDAQVTDDALFVAHYIMAHRKVKSHFSAKISTLLARILRRNYMTPARLGPASVFCDIVVFITSTTSNCTRVLDFFVKLLYLNEESCLCKHNKDMCHHILVFCTACSSTPAFWTFENTLLVHSILSQTARSAHHVRVSEVDNARTAGVLEKMFQHTHSLAHSGNQWELLNTKVTDTLAVKHQI